MTTSMVTDRRKGDPQHMLRGKKGARPAIVMSIIGIVYRHTAHHSQIGFPMNVGAVDIINGPSVGLSTPRAPPKLKYKYDKK